MPGAGRRGRGRGRGRGRRRWGEPTNNDGGNHEAVAPPVNEEPAEVPEVPEVPESPENPDSSIEPRKVYIGNLSKELRDKDLYEKMCSYVSVVHTRIRRDRYTKKSKGFAFVEVNTAEEVKILLKLSGKDLNLGGQPMKIKHAHEKIDTRPVGDRDFDLSPVDPKKPSMHMLMNDVLIGVLGFLNLRDMVRCERVCRRWQEVIHGMFAKKPTLHLSRESLGLDGPVSISLASKLLSLHGSDLKELKVESIDYSTEQQIQQDMVENGLHILQASPTKDHIMKLIAFSCPNLEILELSMLSVISCHNIKVMARQCTKLKSFTAKKCRGFDELSYKTLLDLYPNLQVIGIKDCQIQRFCFDLLPQTLKELRIANCPNNVKSGLDIGRRCPHLEVLQLGNLEIPTDVLFAIGSMCPKLTDLKIYFRYRFEGTLEEFPNFINLKSLSICVDNVDLRKLICQLPFLEKLCITGEDESNATNFGELKDLKKLRLGGRMLKENSSATISQCQNLEEFLVDKPGTITENTLLSIIRGCTKIKFLQCAGMRLGLNFISSLNKIMAKRNYKIKILIHSFSLTTKELLEAQYDLKKIEFEPSDFLTEIDYPFSDYCESESDDEESEYGDCFYDNLWLL